MIAAPVPAALLDSNVLVAILAEEHEHHTASIALIERAVRHQFCVAAHSYAEAFTTLTRRGHHAPYRREPDDVQIALESLAALTKLVGLSPAQTLDAVRSYAGSGGVGARIYDWLIGKAALTAGAGAIVTWNVGHMRSLFPDLIVRTPSEFTDLSFGDPITRQ